MRLTSRPIGCTAPDREVAKHSFGYAISGDAAFCLAGCVSRQDVGLRLRATFAGQEFRSRSHSDLADGIGTGGYLFASILLDLAAG